jgi:hypothetical protein
MEKGGKRGGPKLRATLPLHRASQARIDRPIDKATSIAHSPFASGSPKVRAGCGRSMPRLSRDARC